ncbi:MAG: SET domain-containing protein [Chlorobiaceae bacterium]|nr:SET domain-containing protein [Chlorobiaceae bacterium]
MTPDLYLVATVSALLGAAAGVPAGMILRRKKASIKRGAVRIDASTVSGRGAFADRAISSGETIERCPALEVADKDVGGELLNYVFYGNSENLRLVAMGYGMLFNHSPQPNVAYYREDSPLGAELVLYALRDIRKGEELFYNYGDDWWTTRK